MITVENISLSAVLHDTPTAAMILESLPLKGTTHIWGEEIYFEIPLQIEPEPEARADVEVGDLGYWPTGTAFCIFFGPTPVSVNEKPRAFSPVNIFGRVTDDCAPLKSVPNGAGITINRA